MELTFVTSLDAVEIVDVLTANNANHGNWNCTFCMIIKSPSGFESINKHDRDYSYWKILSLVFPLKYQA